MKKLPRNTTEWTRRFPSSPVLTRRYKSVAAPAVKLMTSLVFFRMMNFIASPEIIGTISHDSLRYKGNVIPLFCLTD